MNINFFKRVEWMQTSYKSIIHEQKNNMVVNKENMNDNQ